MFWSRPPGSRHHCLHVNRCAFHKQQPDCFFCFLFFQFCVYDIIGLDLEKRGGPPPELQTWKTTRRQTVRRDRASHRSGNIARVICYGDLFMFPTKSKTKLKAIICALPQGGHLTGNNYVVVALSRNLVFLYETFASIYTVYLYLELESLLIIII